GEVIDAAAGNAGDDRAAPAAEGRVRRAVGVEAVETRLAIVPENGVEQFAVALEEEVGSNQAERPGAVGAEGGVDRAVVVVGGGADVCIGVGEDEKARRAVDDGIVAEADVTGAGDLPALTERVVGRAV